MHQERPEASGTTEHPARSVRKKEKIRRNRTDFCVVCLERKAGTAVACSGGPDVTGARPGRSPGNTRRLRRQPAIRVAGAEMW